MRVADFGDDVRPKPGFWSMGSLSMVEVMAAVSILAIMVGIMAGTVAG